MRKHAEKYGTHQSVLEHALEQLGSAPHEEARLSGEEELWMRMGREISKSLSVIQVDAFKVALETVDFDRFKEYVARYKPVEFAIEYIYQKPLTQCTLPELIDGVILNIKMQNTYETVSYTDKGGYYMLSLAHNLGLNGSRLLSIMNESAFESYGARTESHVSERSIFIKIYKK